MAAALKKKKKNITKQVCWILEQNVKENVRILKKKTAFEEWSTLSVSCIEKKKTCCLP